MDPKLLTEVEEYDAVPSDAASYGKSAFWDERYAGDEEVSGFGRRVPKVEQIRTTNGSSHYQ